MIFLHFDVQNMLNRLTEQNTEMNRTQNNRNGCALVINIVAEMKVQHGSTLTWEGGDEQLARFSHWAGDALCAQ